MSRKTRITIVGAGILTLLAPPPFERVFAQSPKPITMAVVGGQVVDGSGAGPIPDGVVLVAGDRIAAVGSGKALPVPAGTKVVRADGMTVMPGLIDMHVHLCLVGYEEDNFILKYMDREEREIMPASARQFLMNGVTSVRDLGSPLEIVKVRDRINRGELPGTRMFVAGPYLQHNPEDFPGWSWYITSADDARQKVRQLVAAGVDWIKVHDTINFSDDELQAIMEEAGKGRKPIAGHAYVSDAEIARALRYHYKTLEHTGIGSAYAYGDDVFREVIYSDACIVPTLARRSILTETEKFPARLNDAIAAEYLAPDLYAAMHEALLDYPRLPLGDHERRWMKNISRKFKPFVDAGACIVTGTDSGESLEIQGSTTWYELKNFVEFGMTPLEAITAATSRPGRLLAPDIGALRPGYHADIILVKGDVLADINLLQNVTHVIKDGVQYK